MKDDTHSTSFVSMSKKLGEVKFKSKKRLKLESWKIANKMLIFASIFKNSKLPKAHLSYESPHMFKFSLGLIQTAQSCSENERPQKKRTRSRFAYKMLIFASIFKNSKLPKPDLSYKSPHMFKFSLCLLRAAQYRSENEQPIKRTH